ncbi:MAG: hypothetical protein ACI4RP_03090 [Acutalibacteraceae bacterium]
MITVLDIAQDARTGIFARAASVLKCGEVSVQIREYSGVRVKYISCSRSQGRVDWAKIADFAGRARGYILCEKGLQLPKRLGFRRFYSRSLYRLMAINGAITALSLLRTDCRRLSLCFCDLSGEYSRYAPLFLPLCGEMTVLTKSRAYSGFADYALAEYGACVRISSNQSALSGCNVIVSPRLAQLENIGGGCVMFTSGGISRNPEIKTVSDYSWGIPPEYRELKPYFLSAEYFSQALYSIAKCTDASKAAPYAFYSDGQRLSAGDVAAYILDAMNAVRSSLDTDGLKAYN